MRNSTIQLGIIFIIAFAMIARADTPATAPSERKVLYSINFEDGKGVFDHVVKFQGSWTSNEEKDARLSLDKPWGKGNDSKLALTVHALKSMPYVTTETNIKGIIVEPEGYDGGLKFRIYNGGFTKMYALYLPIMPSDITFHRAYFEAPVGQWTDVDLSLDKFLFHDRRPRRGCTLEIISIVGEGPQSDDAVFQFDDLELYQVKETNPSQPRPKALLPAGKSYSQNFDDPNDFDIQSFYPYTKNANTYRITREDDAKDGVLKLECYDNNADYKGGRQIQFAAKDQTIEFDILAQDTTDVGVMMRSANMRARQYLSPQLEMNKWTHYSISAEEFAPYDKTIEDGKTNKLSKDEKITMLFFTGHSGKEKEHALLIDNLVIHTR